jgi:hypothetical protein
MSPRSTIERKKAVERARGALHNANTAMGRNVPLNVESIPIAGTWNLALGIFFLSHGHQWGSVLVAVSALIFLAAYFLGRGKFGSRGNSLS